MEGENSAFVREKSKEIKDIHKVVIYGCGGHARSVVNTIRELCGEVEIILVDQNAGQGEIILDCRTQQEYELCATDHYMVAVGDNRKRTQLYQVLCSRNKGKCISVISDRSCIGIDARIGEGTFVAPNAFIGPQAVVGNNTIVNTGSIIEHEVRIGDNSHIAPHATVCGRTEIGNNVFCGAGSVIINNVKVCDDVIISAGAVVKEDIVEAGTYAGVPAVKIK